jgi:outer membrane protein TolC
MKDKADVNFKATLLVALFFYSQQPKYSPNFLKIFLVIILFIASANLAIGQQFIAIPFTQQAPEKKSGDTASPGVAQTPVTSSSILTREEAVKLALAQASALQQAQINERIAGEDLRQSQKAFLPKLSGSTGVIYTSPAPGVSIPATPSFIGANAITEYQGLVGVTGDIDINGRLHATLKRNQALLEAARAGTAVAQRALILATNEAYYGFAVAVARRRSADQSLSAAREFQQITELLLKGGEVAELDLVRARLQVNRRLDELEQARTEEVINREGLRLLIGGNVNTTIEITDLTSYPVEQHEIDRFTAEAITRRPEFAQLEAERLASEQDVKAARAERRPQLSYSINSGFISDSLKSTPLHNHSGVSATINLNIPIFDWGASKSREQQAKLKTESIKIEKEIALRTFAQQFYAARVQASTAINRVQIANRGMQDAERNVAASIARYRAGEAQFVEVSDAQNTLVTQRAALYQAIFDYEIALSRLAQATGQ